MVAVLDNLHQVATLRGGQPIRSPIIQDQQVSLDELAEEAWEPSVAMTLALNASSSSAIATFSSCKEKNRRLRSRAAIQRWISWTPTSTLALSRGRLGRAGASH